MHFLNIICAADELINVDAALLQECAHVGFAVVQGHNLKIHCVFVVSIEPIEGGRFVLAGRSPTGPEDQNRGFSLEALRRYRRTVHGGAGESGSGLPRTGRRGGGDRAARAGRDARG